jgi:hypothetical protein
MSKRRRINTMLQHGQGMHRHTTGVGVKTLEMEQTRGAIGVIATPIWPEGSCLPRFWDTRSALAFLSDLGKYVLLVE